MACTRGRFVEGLRYKSVPCVGNRCRDATVVNETDGPVTAKVMVGHLLRSCRHAQRFFSPVNSQPDAYPCRIYIGMYVLTDMLLSRQYDYIRTHARSSMSA